MGFFDSTETKSINQTDVKSPWAVQTPYLSQGFQGAQSAMTDAQDATKPTGFQAQYTPDQLALYQKMLGYGMNTPGISADSAAAANKLTTSGAGAAAGGLFDLANYGRGTGPDAMVAEANAFANNPAIGGMVDASMRDARRSVYEGAIPQSDRVDAASGNLYGSKGELRKGVIERGLADATADTSANMRGAAFNQGLTLAGNRDQNALQAMLARVSGGNTAASTGINAGNASIAQQGGLFDIANQGVGGQLAGTQAGFDDQKQRYGFESTQPFDALNQYWNIVGGQNWGGTTNSTGTSTASKDPSTMAKIGSSIGAISSLLSDVRAKTDIVSVGELFDGQTVYRYRYVGDPSTTVHIGLLAQEVRREHPMAVNEVDGVLYVNYDLATRASTGLYA